MKKQLVQFTLHLLILLCSLGGAYYVFLTWTGYFENDSFVAYLYDNTPFQLIEIDQLAESFATNEIPFESAPLYGDTTERVAKMIENGANSIILNLKASPTDSLIALAKKQDVTLFFVGALPSQVQISSYDKIWCFTQSSAYAGELLGTQTALGFRNGDITDQNADLLLDYTFLVPDSTYMSTEETIDSTLLELDHYGVYATDVYDAAYRAALAATTTDSAEASTDESATEPEAASAKSTDFPASTSGTAPTIDVSLPEVTIALSNLSNVELLLTIGGSNAKTLADQVSSLGWFDSESPATFACIVENRASAEQLSKTGLYYSIIYLDTYAATEALTAMSSNAWAQIPITNGTDFAENDTHTFVIDHLIY